MRRFLAAFLLTTLLTAPCLVWAQAEAPVVEESVPEIVPEDAVKNEKPIQIPQAEEKKSEDGTAAAPEKEIAPPPAVEPPPLTEMPRAEMEDMKIAVLRTIDKLSARTHTFDVPVDKTVKFSHSLFIKPRACRKSSPISQPESAAFLQIWERKPHETESKWVFSGWMFSSSPSLSAMDHPVYDVWVIDCKNASSAAASEKFSAEQAPEKSPENENPSENSPAKQTGDDTSGEKSSSPAVEKEEEEVPNTGD